MTVSHVHPQGLEWTTIRQAVLVRDKHRCVECHTPCASDEADVHHLVPRSAGGSDEPSNLVTLCDGCHAAHHPKLAGRLARRTLERWAVRLALWLDRNGSLCEASRNFGPALRLFGLERFREGQLPIVQAALNGRSVLVVCPTGFGKTLCFQLPATLRHGISIVVSPLRALMGDQVSALLRRKIPSTFINSDLDRDEKSLRYALLAKKGFKLLYLAPERFSVKNRREVAALRSLTPSYLVIDEAHCVDQWGRDFRPEYGRLKEVREALGNPPVLAFTATAGQEMQQRILASLGVDDAQIFVRGVNRPNIALLRWNLAPERRAQAIAQLCRIAVPQNGKVMIFVPTRKIGEALERHLGDVGLKTPFYHSNSLAAMLMHPNGGRVDHLQVAVIGGRHGLEDAIPDADLGPAPEAVGAGGRRPIALRDVVPGRARPKPPIDAVQHLAVVRPRLVRQKRLDNRPLEVAQLVASRCAHQGSSQNLESPRPSAATPL